LKDENLQEVCRTFCLCFLLTFKVTNKLAAPHFITQVSTVNTNIWLVGRLFNCISTVDYTKTTKLPSGSPSTAQSRLSWKHAS